MAVLSDIFGSKPKVPKLEKLDLGDEQKKAVQNNLDVLPEAEQLASRVNLFSRDQIDQMLAAAGGGSLLSDSADQIGKMIKGEIPLADEQMQHLRSVSKSFGGGTAGSGSMGNLVARDLGLLQLDVIGKGLSSAESWLRTTAALYEPGMMDVTSMFVTPMQQYGVDNEQNLQQFQREWMKNQIEAMPNPRARGVHDTIMSLVTSYFGGSYGGTFNGAQAASATGGGGGGGGGFMMNARAPEGASMENTPYGPG